MWTPCLTLNCTGAAITEKSRVLIASHQGCVTSTGPLPAGVHLDHRWRCRCPRSSCGVTIFPSPQSILRSRPSRPACSREERNEAPPPGRQWACGHMLKPPESLISSGREILGGYADVLPLLKAMDFSIRRWILSATIPTLMFNGDSLLLSSLLLR